VSTTPAFVSGGSNLDPERNLLLAARELKTRHPDARFSRCYRNAPVGFEGPDFINFVAELQCKEGPESLRADLDVLLFGALVQDRTGLVLPRPDLVRWAFMLGPLAELAPGLVHPVLGKSIGALWSQFDRDAHPLMSVDLDLNSA
jgi:2-amino-4-hydroxy-6-hydroxymethyldihydropteridine diphosphokinase